jgi:hypothetical protein
MSISSISTLSNPWLSQLATQNNSAQTSSSTSSNALQSFFQQFQQNSLSAYQNQSQTGMLNPTSPVATSSTSATQSSSNPEQAHGHHHHHAHADNDSDSGAQQMASILQQNDGIASASATVTSGSIATKAAAQTA